MCSFKDDIVEYTRLAIQKWYAPKIFNKNLSKYSNQKWLAVRVNDIPIRYQDMRPLFKLVQELYTSALSANKCGVQDYNSEDFKGIRSISVPSQKVQNSRAGFVSTVIVNSSDFGSTGSIIPPQAYLRLFGTLTKNDPITMFARAAGMVMDYKIDGKWTKGMTKPENEDEMLFSFFVPDCTLKLKEDTSLKQFSGMSLGNYLRKCEKSDHMNWTDPASLTVVTNITARVISKVNECYKPKSSTEAEGTASRLSGKLGKKLLPKVNYGKKKGGGSGGEGGSGGSISNLDARIWQSHINSDSMVLNFEIKFMNIRKDAFLGIFVESEVGLVDADAWIKGIGSAFPITISEIRNCSVYSSLKGEKRHALSITQQCNFLKFIYEDEVYHHWFPTFFILINTGLRVGELTGLRWQDVDLDRGVIDINHTLAYIDHRDGTGGGFVINSPKTVNGYRKVLMTDAVKDAFRMEKEYQEQAGIESKDEICGYEDFIFINRFGHVQHQGPLNKAIRRIIRDYNVAAVAKGKTSPNDMLPHFSCHVLRHTYATRAVESGVSVKYLQTQMGHSEIQITMDYYVSPAEEFSRKETQSFEKYMNSVFSTE